MATAPAPSIPAATEPVPTDLQAAPVAHTPLPNGLPAEQQQPPPLQRRQRPRVIVSYARLPPKSKARLEESLVAWAAWHAAAFGDVGADDAYADAGLVVNISQVISETRSSGIGQAPSLINVALQAAVSSDCALACRSGCQSRAGVVLAAGPQWHFATRQHCRKYLPVQATPPLAECSGRLQFEPLALAAPGEEPSIAAGNAWVDVPEGGEVDAAAAAAGKAKFNLAYEQVLHSGHSGTHRQFGQFQGVWQYICQLNRVWRQCRSAMEAGVPGLRDLRTVYDRLGMQTFWGGPLKRETTPT